MNLAEVNPFGILTFIVAPAILTNASSVNVLATTNRLARSVDRARALAAQLERHPTPSAAWLDLHHKLLQYAHLRIQ